MCTQVTWILVKIDSVLKNLGWTLRFCTNTLVMGYFLSYSFVAILKREWTDQDSSMYLLYSQSVTFRASSASEGGWFSNLPFMFSFFLRGSWTKTMEQFLPNGNYPGVKFFKIQRDLNSLDLRSKQLKSHRKSLKLTRHTSILCP